MKEIMSEDFKEVQDMLEQAKELVKTLENKYKELNKPKNVRWRAKKGEDFYIVSGCSKYGNIAYKMQEDFGDYCNYHYNIGDYFKTAQEAEKSYNNLIITQKLKDVALRLNDGVEIDWRDWDQFKWFIYFDGKNLDNNCTHIAKALDIYCLSDKFLETAIKEIGEKELIEYIKGC